MNEPIVRSDDVCVVATVPYSLTVFMAPHIRSMSREYGITLVANGCPAEMSGLIGPSVSFQPIGLSRRISIAADIRSLVELWRLFRRKRFRIVQSITPKAGLLTMIAGRLAGVPVRVHWFTGQVWATKSGFSRWLLKTMDRLLVACSTHVLADSASQGAFLVQEGVIRPGQVLMLGQGSVCGVDTNRFRPNLSARARIRTSIGIPENALVVLYLGRLNRDKGLLELAEAFASAAREYPDLHLLIVGPDEDGTRDRVVNALGNARSRARFVDFTEEPEAHMAASDLFVLPSRREGFPMSVIEAGACEIPTIGTTIYGLRDALVDGESGLLVPVGNAPALSTAISRLATNSDLRHAMGRAARVRVERDFTQAPLTAELMRLYRELLASDGSSSRRIWEVPVASRRTTSVLVTGSTGFIGKALVAQLIGSGRFAVRAVVRRESSAFPDGVEQVVIGDLKPHLDWTDALAGVDVVVHLAGRAHVLREEAVDPIAEFRQTNVTCTLNLARQAATQSVRRFVFMSSVGVNGTTTESVAFSESDNPCPREEYAVSKLEAEEALRQLAAQTSLEVGIIRPPLVYGPDAPGNFGRLCRLVRRGLPLPFGAISNRRSLVALGNLVDFTITCIEHPHAANETFLVSDGEDLSTPELIGRLGNVLECPVRLIPVPASLLMAAAKVLGKQQIVQRLIGSLQVDISKARRVLGWAPPLSVAEGLQRVAAWR